MNNQNLHNRRLGILIAGSSPSLFKALARLDGNTPIVGVVEDVDGRNVPKGSVLLVDIDGHKFGEELLQAIKTSNKPLIIEIIRRRVPSPSSDIIDSVAKLDTASIQQLFRVIRKEHDLPSVMFESRPSRRIPRWMRKITGEQPNWGHDKPRRCRKGQHSGFH